MFKKITLTSSILVTALALSTAAYAGDCNSSKKANAYQTPTAVHNSSSEYSYTLASNDKIKYRKSYTGKKMNHIKGDIIDTAVANGSFNTLASALEAAGLIDTLKGNGPFTVFAPTDEAFAKLPEGTVETLLRPENKEKLVSILTYHVIAGKVKAKDVVKLDKAKTVQGDNVSIKTIDGQVKIDNANVVMTDVKASNGIIHVIDSVILPN